MSPANALPPSLPPTLTLVQSTPLAARPNYERPLPLVSPSQWRALVNRQLAECRRRQTTMAVLAVTLAEVRLADEPHRPGAPAGAALAERVQEHLTQRLRTRVRSSDRVLHIGTDQLGLILGDVDAKGAADIDQRVTPALAGPFKVDEQLAVADVRSGLVVYPGDGSTVDALLGALAARVGTGPAPR